MLGQSDMAACPQIVHNYNSLRFCWRSSGDILLAGFEWFAYARRSSNESNSFLSFNQRQYVLSVIFKTPQALDKCAPEFTASSISFTAVLRSAPLLNLEF